MKRIAVKTTMLIFPALSFGAEVCVTNVGDSQYSDTEVSTNVAFQVDAQGFNRLEFSLDFASSSSNSLEVAIGNDINLDGILTFDEAELTFGCDCGEWFIRSSEKDSVKWEGDQGSNARTFILRKSEMKSDWNLVKIIRRGVNVSSEFVRIRQSFSGLHLIVQ